MPDEVCSSLCACIISIMGVSASTGHRAVYSSAHNANSEIHNDKEKNK